jgi:hypothetical protein
VFGNSVRSLMLVLLTTSHSVWLPVARAQPVPGGPEYTTNNHSLPPVAMDSTGNLVVVWFGDGEPRVGHRSIALLSYSADTSSGREGRVGRETDETSARPSHVGAFAKSHVPSVSIHPSPSSSWNGGSRLP